MAAEDEQPCRRHIEAGHPFPSAQCILSGTFGDGLFRRVQEQIGLLQTVVLFGQLVDEPTRTYKLEHLESIPGLRLNTPWIRRVPTGDKSRAYEADPRAPGMAEVFRQFRERATGVQEFVRLLESENGHELILGASPSSTDRGLATFYEGSRLDAAEEEHHFLLVSDQEQSFFSLLYVLSEADAHARATKISCEDWIAGQSIALRSILCHQHPALDNEPPAPPKGDSAIDPASGDYWRAASFIDAMIALGLLANCGDGPTESPRFARLVARLRLARDWHVLRMATSGSGNPGGLVDDVGQYCAAALRKDSLTVHELAHSILGLLRGVYPSTRDANAVRTSRDVRFNLPGEYLLRRGETASRSFFATPLSYAHDVAGQRPLAAAFAVGTLDDFNEITESTLPRLQALRALLRALVTFGTDVAQSWLLTARREAEDVQDLNHSIRNAFAPVLYYSDYLETVLGEESCRQKARALGGGLKILRWLVVQALPGPSSEDSLPPTSIVEMLTIIKTALDNEIVASTLNVQTEDVVVRTEEAHSAFSVVYNLWHNAIKAAAGQQEPRVTVRLFARRQAGAGKREVCLSVENTGERLPEGYRAFLLGTALPPADPASRRRRRGLWLVATKLRSVGWRIDDVQYPISGGTTVLVNMGFQTGGRVNE